MGKELHRCEDEWGPIVVTQRGRKRVLSFGSEFEQSSVILDRPASLTHEYTRIMLLGLLFSEPAHITLLGLGGGGLLHCLARFYPAVPIKVVELRQQVIAVARDWFEIPQNRFIDIDCANAADHVRNADAGDTDLILSDLYEAEGMSEDQTRTAYLQNCFTHLSDDGVLVLNFHRLPDTDDPLMLELSTLFSQLWVCDVFKGNQVLFCLKQEADISTRAAEAKQLAKKFKLPLIYYYRQLRKITL